MPRKATASDPAAPPIYQPGRTYRVTLARPARVAGILFRPLGELEFEGTFLTRLIEENGADAVASVAD